MVVNCIFRVGAGLLLFSSLLFHPFGYADEADDYFRQIEKEVKELADNPITTRSSSIASILDTTERLPLGLRQEAFEKALEEQFVGTYLFYQRLTPDNKKQIYKLYQQDNRVSTIREQTLKLLSGGLSQEDS